MSHDYQFESSISNFRRMMATTYNVGSLRNVGEVTQFTIDINGNKGNIFLSDKFFKLDSSVSIKKLGGSDFVSIHDVDRVYFDIWPDGDLSLTALDGNYPMSIFRLTSDDLKIYRGKTYHSVSDYDKRAFRDIIYFIVDMHKRFGVKG